MNHIDGPTQEFYLLKADLAFTPNLLPTLTNLFLFYLYSTLKCKNRWVKAHYTYIYIYIYIHYTVWFGWINLHQQKENKILYSQKRDIPMQYQWWQCLPLIKWHWGGVLEVYLQYTFSSIQATCWPTYVDLSVHLVHQDISNISLFCIARCTMGNDEKKHLSRRLQISLTN